MVQNRRALIDPIDVTDPCREGIFDHLASARGYALPVDPAQARSQLEFLRTKLRPLFAITVTCESKRLLGVNQSHCRLSDVDGWLKILPS